MGRRCGQPAPAPRCFPIPTPWQAVLSHFLLALFVNILFLPQTAVSSPLRAVSRLHFLNLHSKDPKQMGNLIWALPGGQPRPRIKSRSEHPIACVILVALQMVPLSRSPILPPLSFHWISTPGFPRKPLSKAEGIPSLLLTEQKGSPRDPFPLRLRLWELKSFNPF